MFSWGVSAGEPSGAPNHVRSVPLRLPLLVLLLAALPVAGYAITSASAHEAAQGSAQGSALKQPQASAASFEDNLHSTQTLLGGDWQVRDDPNARACALPGGGTGEATPALRISVRESAPSADSPSADSHAQSRLASGSAQLAGSAKEPLASVASAWRAWGYVVSQGVIRLSTGDVTELQARGDAGEYLILRANDTALVLQGESACNAP